ncbi:MAG: hypothetical protein OXH82_02860 [Candidatus Dadabacteria bacterium]|nr:hypothetical protein [Candidatus Dadabacteria bacterium]MDE0662857.1 hypothetical protein [Candidatus Dadabacteria bacterium]
MKIMSWLDSEDYWYMNSLSEQNKEINYYGYVMEVGDEEDSSKAKIMVVELHSAKLTVGFIVPLSMDLSGQIDIGFICQERPEKDIPFSCKLSGEVKNLSYTGDDLQKIEYAGLALEKFYQNNGIKFSLLDLRSISEQNQDRP